MCDQYIIDVYVCEILENYSHLPLDISTRCSHKTLHRHQKRFVKYQGLGTPYSHGKMYDKYFETMQGKRETKRMHYTLLLHIFYIHVYAG